VGSSSYSGEAGGTGWGHFKATGVQRVSRENVIVKKTLSNSKLFRLTERITDTPKDM